MSSDLLYQIALTLVPNIGDVQAKALVNHYGSAKDIFKARKKELETIEGIGAVRAKSIKEFADFSSSEAEMAFIEQYNITPLFLTHPDYPRRLLNCYDCPTLLYYKGNANLNSARVISVVGTRNHSEYGKHVAEKLVTDLAAYGVLVVSGLAFGIDTIAHKAALKNNLSTVGVLAHGLDRMYPPQNKTLAKQMTDQGGLLTDYISNTEPGKQNFPRRNRIVAGMCDALVVVETAAKGGSLITAELANGYNKDVFAFPGKTTDSKSEGCNLFIKQNKASLITCAADIAELMNWDTSAASTPKQKQLFVELTADEKIITALLQQQPVMQVDELYFKSGLSSSAMAQALLMLEMNGIITTMPGKMYTLS
ncbi:MAG: DNA-protecting protein DprA [Bacteroidetes bacterium]|nr:DNA-protecting protein DprA [Bacteroidota bacterium]